LSEEVVCRCENARADENQKKQFQGRPSRQQGDYDSTKSHFGWLVKIR